MSPDRFVSLTTRHTIQPNPLVCKPVPRGISELFLPGAGTFTGRGAKREKYHTRRHEYGKAARNAGEGRSALAAGSCRQKGKRWSAFVNGACRRIGMPTRQSMNKIPRARAWSWQRNDRSASMPDRRHQPFSRKRTGRTFAVSGGSLRMVPPLFSTSTPSGTVSVTVCSTGRKLVTIMAYSPAGDRQLE